MFPYCFLCLGFTYLQSLPGSYRGQAQQRAGQFPVVSRVEKQTGGEAFLRAEGQSDVPTGVIWGGEDESSEIMIESKIRKQGSYEMSTNG